MSEETKKQKVIESIKYCLKLDWKGHSVQEVLNLLLLDFERLPSLYTIEETMIRADNLLLKHKNEELAEENEKLKATVLKNIAFNHAVANINDAIYDVACEAIEEYCNDENVVMEYKDLIDDLGKN